MDKSFAMITGPKAVTGVKRKRVNVNHIMPLEDKIDIKRGAFRRRSHICVDSCRFA
jgi:large subunit ribosomal protein L14e